MTTRDITATNQTATLERVVRPVIYGRFAFSSGVKRFHTQIGPRTAVHPVFGSESYIGVGDFGGITVDVVESVSNAAEAIKVSLSAINSGLVSDALTDDYHGRDVDFLVGFDDANGDLVDDPVELWSGYMDTVEIALSERTAEMTLTAESRALIGRRASDLRFTDEQLQHDFTGDLAGEYIFRMPDLVLAFGGDNQRAQSGPGRGYAF